MTLKRNFEKQLYTDKDGLRFATPWEVAAYRAKRLSCTNIADISCGIGGQTIYFAKECEFVYAIEINPIKLKLARKNCKMFGLDNIKFICGNALDKEVIEQIPEIDIVFSDPARAIVESKRDINRLQPNIDDVIKLYAEKTNNFAFEAPPQLTADKIPYDCECEYLSLNGKINRLNLYFGEIKSCDISAVALSSNSKLSNTGQSKKIDYSEEPLKYLYEIDPAVIKSGLISQLAFQLDNVKLFKLDDKRIMFTAAHIFTHPMINNTYEIVFRKQYDIEKINTFLKNTDYGQVVLRANIKDSTYWDIRKKLELELKGKEQITLFVKEDIAYLCNKL